MIPIISIDVKITGCMSVSGKNKDVNMLSFVGTAHGDVFSGKVAGEGVDLQCFDKNGSGTLSARYMLEGTDKDGESCRIFIENNGNEKDGFVPRVTTDSKALAYLEDAALTARITPDDGGVTVDIFINGGEK